MLWCYNIADTQGCWTAEESPLTLTLGATKLRLTKNKHMCGKSSRRGKKASHQYVSGAQIFTKDVLLALLFMLYYGQ